VAVVIVLIPSFTSVHTLFAVIAETFQGAVVPLYTIFRLDGIGFTPSILFVVTLKTGRYTWTSISGILDTSVDDSLLINPPVAAPVCIVVVVAQVRALVVVGEYTRRIAVVGRRM